MPPDDFSEEIDRLEERAARDPRTHTFARLADLYRKAGELDRALQVIESGLRQHPHYLNARIVHARLLRELGRRGEAVVAFERVLQIDSENLVARTALTEMREGERPGPAAMPEAPAGAVSSGWLARLEADWHSGRDEPPGTPGPPSAEVPEATVEEPGSEGATDEADAPEPEPVAESDVAAGPEPAPSTEPEPAPSTEPEPAPAVESEPAAAAEPEPEPTAAAWASPGRENARDLETATLAELYARQGLLDEAIGIFERLLARDPYNARLATSLEEARTRARSGSGSRPDARPAAPPLEVERSGRDAGSHAHPEPGVREAARGTGPREPRAHGASGPESSGGSAGREAVGGRVGPERRERPGDVRVPGTRTPPSPEPASAPAGRTGSGTETIREFLGRLLEGRFELPEGATDGAAVDAEPELGVDEWLRRRGI